MELNEEVLALTVLGVNIVVQVLKKNGLNNNLLATMATIIGSGLYMLQVGFSVQNAIIGLAAGAIASGLFDTIKGLGKYIDLFNKGKQLFGTEVKEDTETKDKTSGEE